MEPSGASGWIVILVQMFLLDLLLCADNAMVIAMLCRSMPAADARRAMVLGTSGAFGVRLVMALLANVLLVVPYLKGAAALVLLLIAINSIGHRRQGAPGAFAEATEPSLESRGVIWPVVLVIMLMDTALGFDNVVALAAMARGNLWLLAIGVVLTIPAVAFGAVILGELGRFHPSMATIGRGFLGWIAGGMAISDPAIASWANSSAPALVLIAPALGAILAVVEARIIASDVRRSASERARAPEFAMVGNPHRSRRIATAGVERASPRRLRLLTRLARAASGQKHRIVLIGSVVLSVGMFASLRYIGGLLLR